MVVALVLGSVLLAILTLVRNGDASAPTFADLDSALPAVTAVAQQRLERVVQSMWWHQPRFINGLALDADLRRKMDVLCRAALSRRWQLRRFERDHRPSFQQALKANDLDQARRSIELRHQAAAELATVEQRLVVDAMSLLSTQQTSALTASYPGLLSGAWLVDVGRRPAPPVDP